MFAPKIPLLLASAGILGLAACTDPYTGERNRQNTGALIGAGIGAIAGATRGDDANDRRQNAIVGAAIGAAGGAGVGSLLDRQAQELKAELSNQVAVINTGSELIVRMPQDILFATDSAQVSGTLYGDLQSLAANLNRYSSTIVEVQGHTDNTGAAAYNQDLSQRRAQSVASILYANGVSPSRVRVVGYGENQPIATNLDPAGRAQNRRVEIVIRPTR